MISYQCLHNLFAYTPKERNELLNFSCTIYPLVSEKNAYRILFLALFNTIDILERATCSIVFFAFMQNRIQTRRMTHSYESRDAIGNFQLKRNHYTDSTSNKAKLHILFC